MGFNIFSHVTLLMKTISNLINNFTSLFSLQTVLLTSFCRTAYKLLPTGYELHRFYQAANYLQVFFSTVFKWTLSVNRTDKKRSPPLPLSAFFSFCFLLCLCHFRNISFCFVSFYLCIYWKVTFFNSSIISNCFLFVSILTLHVSFFLGMYFRMFFILYIFM